MGTVTGMAHGLVLLSVPFVLGAWYRRRVRLPWDIYIAGAMGFIASQIVHIPLLYFWLAPALKSNGAGLAVTSLALGLAAGICEEPARWAVFRYWLRGRDSWPEGVLTGLGHGGVEASLLGLLVLLSVVGALSIPHDGDVTTRLQAVAVLDASPFLRLVSVFERATAITMHVCLSVVVQRAVVFSRPGLLVAAIAAHAAVDGAIVCVGGALVSATASATTAMLVVQLMLFACACAAVLVLRVLYLSSPHLRGVVEAPPVLPEGDQAVCSRGLGKTFDGRAAVEDLDLDVQRGEVFALLGPNGAGKTTTVRMLCGLIAPTSGAARVAGHPLDVESSALHERIGFLTETPGLYERLSARENLEIFGRLYGVDPDTLDARIEQHLQSFGLWERRDEATGGFSKGMKQKLAIIRALLHEPEVVFLDEPTSGLDPEAAREVLDLIADLKRQGRTILLTTHRLEEAEELATRVGIVRGRMLAVDTFDNLRTRLYGRQIRVRLHARDSATRYLDTVRGLDFVREVQCRGGEIVVSLDDPDEQSSDIVRTLVEAGASIRGVEDVKHSLEEVYLDMMGASS